MIFLIFCIIIVLGIACSFVENTQMEKRKEMIKTIVIPNDPSNKVVGIVIDCETTGLNPSKDEILQLSIIDTDENILFNSYFKPEKRKRWPKAQEINGITPKMVANAPTLNDCWDKIREILLKYQCVIGYNILFDCGFLEANNLDTPYEKIDVMDMYSKYKDVSYEYYDRDEECYKTTLRRFSLSQCADEFDFEYNAHNSLEDCRATLHCFKKLVLWQLNMLN